MNNSTTTTIYIHHKIARRLLARGFVEASQKSKDKDDLDVNIFDKRQTDEATKMKVNNTCFKIMCLYFFSIIIIILIIIIIIIIIIINHNKWT
jgi:lipopolysaccharide/colanic/teichoic acid biosynthesis glycosyltransferase